MSNVQFVFSLLDKMSGPAKGIAGALGRVQGALGDAKIKAGGLPPALDKALGGMNRLSAAADVAKRFLKGTATEADALKVGSLAFAGAQKAATAGMGAAKDGAMALGSGLLSVAGAAAMATAAVGAAAGGLVVAGAKYALEMAQFKEQSEFAWKLALGSADKASTTLGYAQSIANTMGTSVRGIAGQLSSLFKQGFGARESEQIVQMVASLKAITGEDYTQQLGQSFMALKKRESLTPQMLEPLLSMGPAAQGKVFATLAKSLNITTKNAEQQKREVLARLGELKGQRGIDALSKAYFAATGEKKAGDVAKTFQGTTITGSIDKIKNKVESLFAKLNTSGVGTKLVSIMQKIAAAIDPATPSGERLVKTLDKAAEVAGRIFGKIDIDKVIAGFDQIVTKVDGMLGPIEEFAGGFSEGLGEAISTVMEVAQALGLADSSASGFSGSFKSIGKAAGYVVAGIGTVIASVIAIEVKLATVALSVLKAGADIGLNIIAGIASGLASAKGMLEDALKELAASLPEAVRKVLKIQSPSKVFEAIGSFSIQGFTQGVEKEQDNAIGATVAALSPPASAPTRGAGASQSISAPITITVNGGEDAKKTAALVEQSVTRAMLAVFEGVALESGAVST